MKVVKFLKVALLALPLLLGGCKSKSVVVDQPTKPLTPETLK